MDTEIVLLALLSILTLSFSLNILRRKFGADKRQLLLFGVVFSQFLWTVSILLTLVFYRLEGLSLLLSRASFGLGTLIAVFFILLTVELCDPIKRKMAHILVVTQLLWIPLSFTSLVLAGVEVRGNSLVSFDGTYKELYTVSLALAFVYAFHVLYKTFKNTQNANFKYQIKYILAGGFVSMSIAFASNLIIPTIFGIEIRSLGPLSLMFFVGMTFYAVTRHRFLKLNIALGSIVSFVLLTIVPLGTFFLVYELNTRLWGSIYTVPAIISGLGESSVFILLFLKLHTFFRSLINRHINSNFFKTKKIIDAFEQSVLTEVDTKHIYRKVRQLLNSHMNIPVYCLIELDEGNIFRLFTKGKLPQNLHKLVPLLTWVGSRGYRFIDLTESKEINSTYYDILINLEIEAIFYVDANTYFILFSKSDNRVYSTYEIEFLMRITQALGIALQRAGLYEQQAQFNQRLQQEVDEATWKISSQKELLQQKYEEERDMIGILGHELRTPLTVAKNMAELLQTKVHCMEINGTVDYKYIRQKIETIHDALTRETNIVETALSTSRIDNEKVQVHTDDHVNLEDIISFAVDAFQSSARQKGIILQFKRPGFKIPVILSDTAKVQEIVTNLVSNAIKYTFKGKVTISLTKDDTSITLLVKDTGEGIPKDALKKIGQKFFRVNQYLDGSDNVIRPGGTGLGLYVVKNYVKLIGGELDITSEVGKGSTFSVTLPLIEPREHSNTHYAQADESDMFAVLGLAQ